MSLTLPRWIGCLGLLFLAGCMLEFDRTTIADSCADLPPCLGATSCCETAPIAGGTFDRGYDSSDTNLQPGADAVEGWQSEGQAPASVSAFRMDRFEATVGRFEAFLADYDAWRGRGQPSVGAGAHPTLGTSSAWQASFSAQLPETAEALRGQLDCSGSTLGLDPRLPMNCVDWYVAFAFCIWDGARLPTEAEWNFVAAAGDEQRAFPWSVPADDLTIDLDHAVTRVNGSIQVVGSRAALDAGRFDVHDLAGNVREWVLDYVPSDLGRYEPASCSDCANLLPSPRRMRRGGDWGADAARARSAYRSTTAPNFSSEFLGVRCVRD